MGDIDSESFLPPSPSHEAYSYGSITVEEDAPSEPPPAGNTRRRRSSVYKRVAEKLLGPDDDCCHVQEYQGQATILRQVISISKNLIGGGSLFLPKGIAMYGDSPRAAYAASIYIALAALLFAYFGALIGRVCSRTRGASSYTQCWDRSVIEFGSTHHHQARRWSALVSLTVSMIVTIQPALAYLGLSNIMVATFLPLLQAAGVHLITQTQLLLLITVFVILPLVVFKGKNLLSLAPISFLGMVGIVYTAMVMVVRSLDGSYVHVHGKYYQHSAVPPAFGTTNCAWSTDALPFFCILFETWILMHYNIPRYYTELKDASFPRFVQTIGFAFSGTSLVYMAIAVSGFLTFGRNVEGFVLNSYSPQDPLLTIGRLTFGMSVLTTLPLVFVGVRDGLLDCLSIESHSQTTFCMNIMSIGLLAFLTFASIGLMSSLDVIKAATQGTLATVLVFVFPYIMYKRTAAQHDNKTCNVWISMVLMLVGVALGATGTVVAASMAEMKRSVVSGE